MRGQLIRLLPRVRRELGRVVDRFWIDPETRAFIQHNRKVWGGTAPPDTREGVILLDLQGIQPLLVAESYLLNLIQARVGGELVAHSIPGREKWGSWQATRHLRETFKSMNVREHLPVTLSAQHRGERRRLRATLPERFTSKEEILTLEVRGIGIGLDLYETYLRRFGVGTVDLDDPRLYELLLEGLGLLVFWEDYFQSRDVRAVVSSHDTYLEMNTPVRMAWRYEVPVYICRPNHIMRPRESLTYGSVFPRYRQLFHALPPEVQEAGLAKAQEELTSRLSGGGGGLIYMPNLAFQGEEEVPSRALAESSRFKAVVFAHAFSDAPHSWGGMLFPDFVEWLRFVDDVARQTDFEWYVKCHPAFEEESRRVLGAILESDSPLTVIPGGVSHHQLRAEGMGAGLTCYGTVGHELPLLGIPVVNAGHNPQVAYEFCVTPASREKYREALLNLPSLSCEIDPVELYEFYFLYGYRVYTDDLVFQSFRGLAHHMGGHGRTVSPRSYGYFLREWSEERHAEILQGMEAFLDSDATFSWEVDDPARLLPLLR